MRPRGDDDDDDGDVDVAVSERPLHLNAELERPNAERRDGVREADEAVAREVPTPENATARGIRHDDILDDLDVLAMDYLDVLTTSERATATRYCSSCRKHLVEAHFRSPETKTCVVCLRMHKTYQRRRRRRQRENKRQRRQSDD